MNADRLFEHQVKQILAQASGKTIKRIDRILTVFKGEIDWSVGALQFTFTDDTNLLLYGGGDGERLAVSEQVWQDPLGGELGELDEETKEWVREYGKEELVDVSRKPEYENLIGRKINFVYGIFTEGEEWLCGACFDIQSDRICFLHEGDEYYTRVNEALSKWRNYTIKPLAANP